MNQYYLLELIPENDVIKRKILYKVEFIRPYCVINIILSDNKKLKEIDFVLTDDVDYLYEFFSIKDENKYFNLLLHDSFYKYNLIWGIADYFLSEKITRIYIDLSSKKFYNYYSYSSLDKLSNSNKFISEIDYIYEQNNEYFLVEVKPRYVLSRTKNNKEYIKKVINSMTFLHDSHEFSIKEFKKFNTFRELVLHCIELDKKQFFSEYKDLSNKEKLIYNDYYDILIDVAKVIEL